MSSNSLKDVEAGLFSLRQMLNLLNTDPVAGEEQLIARLDQIRMVKGFISQTIAVLSDMQKEFANVVAENQEVNTGSPPN